MPMSDKDLRRLAAMGARAEIDQARARIGELEAEFPELHAEPYGLVPLSPEAKRQIHSARMKAVWARKRAETAPSARQAAAGEARGPRGGRKAARMSTAS